MLNKADGSPLHNYQKHLTNVLKKIIDFPVVSDSDESFIKVAS